MTESVREVVVDVTGSGQMVDVETTVFVKEAAEVETDYLQMVEEETTVFVKEVVADAIDWWQMVDAEAIASIRKGDVETIHLSHVPAPLLLVSLPHRPNHRDVKNRRAVKAGEGVVAVDDEIEKDNTRLGDSR